MPFASRILVLLLMAIASASLVGGCGGDDEVDRVETKPGDAPGQVDPGRTQPKAKPTPEQIKRDKAEIRDVANRFFAATSRDDFRRACSLYAPEGLSELGGLARCVELYSVAGRQIGIPAGRPVISKISIIDRGETGIVSFRGLAIAMEMDGLEEGWFVDEVAGY